MRLVALYRDGVAVLELVLVPVGVGGGGLAGAVEGFNLCRGEVPSTGGEVGAKLFLVASPYDDAGDGGPLQQPVERDLGYCLAGFSGDLIESVDDFVEVLVADYRTSGGGLVQAADFRQRLAATKLSGEAAPSERAPHQRADSFFNGLRHEFPFVVAADERVVDLVSHVARPSVVAAGVDGFLQMPSGEIGGGDVAHLALAHQLVECVEDFVDGRERVESVHVVDVDVVGAEALERSLDLLQDVGARRPSGVGVGLLVGELITVDVEAEGGFGGDEQVLRGEGA